MVMFKAKLFHIILKDKRQTSQINHSIKNWSDQKSLNYFPLNFTLIWCMSGKIKLIDGMGKQNQLILSLLAYKHFTFV